MGINPTMIITYFPSGRTLGTFHKGVEYYIGWHLFSKSKNYKKITTLKIWPLHLIFKLKKLNLLVIRRFSKKMYVTHVNKYPKRKIKCLLR